MVARQSLEERIAAHRQALHSQPFPGFGHALKRYYGFDEGYVPLNNGSFGACPNYVLDVYKELLDEAERRPDTFLRVQYQPLLVQARAEVAELVGCHVDDLVFVNNATTGVNVVLRGLNGTWQKGDAILEYDTVYGACGKTAQYIVDSNPTFDLQLVKVALSYPVTHDEVVAKTKQAILDAHAKGLNIRIGIVDAISSVPGVIFPWESIVALFRDHAILSLIDGAHAVGQIPLSLRKVDPDFFISNCHKWLSAHRGVALLYTHKRNQHLVPAIPTSHPYISSNLPDESPFIPTTAPSNYVAQWEWTGTMDLSNYLTVPAAIEFRKWMGGEEAIMQHNGALARKAGQIVATRLGKRSVVMEVADDQADKLTASMVNVSIPITPPSSSAVADLAQLASKLQSRLASEHDTFVMFYAHAGKIWIRLSAQVWLEEQDFEWAADKIAQMVLEEELQSKANVA
ncbi:related to isopenicillin N epimerase [Sporisorium reilianum f. sp. reilianum]|uniref:Related to isopenicillin N epimerase n=1 Tax=Sporisorium reilianum f. sp. reilianum TaxID=72559 RepID=A0A2N8UI28_9BASI|nr:related to isopenicillin N epimerase [Sporisorium reilianum f. sp. reilianum]